MRSKYFLMIVLICELLVGCGSSPQYKQVWHKEGVSEYDSKSSESQCRYDLGKDKISREEIDSMFTNCMEGKGFRLKRIRTR